MPKPKTRTVVYAVVRQSIGEDAHTMSVHGTLPSAEDAHGAYQQEYLDKRIEGYWFTIQASIYYE